MTVKDKTTLKSYFETNDIPTQSNFIDLIDTIGMVSLVVAASNASVASKGRADYVCDGTADDVQIQAAIDAVSAAGGGKVILSEGTFSLDAYLSAKTKVSIGGQGFGTILQVSSGTSAHGIYSYNAVNYIVSDLAIDISLAGTGQAGGGSIPCGIYLSHQTAHIDANVIYRNLYIKGAKEVGIITLGVDNVLIVDNIIEGGPWGIHTDEQDYLTIKGNTVFDCTTWGIRITNNTDYSVVSNNVLYNCGGNNTGSISLNDANYNSVIGNTIYDSSTANSVGISIEVAITSTADYNTVSGNTIFMQSSAYGGIGINAGEHNVIVGNNISGSATYGVQESNSADNNIIAGNLVEGSSAGVLLTGSNSEIGINMGNFGLIDYSGSSTINGWESYAYKLLRYKTIGNIVFVNFDIRGTSDQTYANFTVPFTNNLSIATAVAIWVQDNGTWTIGNCTLAANQNQVNLYVGVGSNFTNTGDKSVVGQFFYVRKE